MRNVSIGCTLLEATAERPTDGLTRIPSPTGYEPKTGGFISILCYLITICGNFGSSINSCH